MRRARNRIFFLLYILLFSFLANANNETQVKNKLNDFIKNIELEAEDIQGGAIAIMHGEKVIYKKTFGYTKQNGSSVNDNTLFSLASVSKPIVAIGIGTLVDKGKINFDDQVKLPYFKNKITLKDILSHTTGYSIRGDKEIESGYNRKKLLNFLQKQKPHFMPGKSYHYSNLTYSLAVESLQKKGYKLSNVITSLNRKTETEGISFVTPKLITNLAKPHSRDRKELSFPSRYQKHAEASAGLLASLNDMIEFIQISMGNRPNIISRKTLNKMYEPVIEADDVLRRGNLPFDNDAVISSYGLGWRILTLKGNQDSKFVCHGGFINGATTFVGFMPSKQYSIIILTNQTAKFAFKNGVRFWKTIIEDDIKVTAK
jgi:beta-lactamase class C